MKKVLLHICCCGCASVAIKRLKEEGFTVKGFFFNPNIHPLREYERRKNDLSILRKVFSVDIIEGSYNPREWFPVCKEYAQEEEGGERCRLCYGYRLRQTYPLCKKLNFDFFTTTLTVSPHKRSHTIFDVGHTIGGDCFLERDFKKKNGFKESVEFSMRYALYRQNYCGCVYSLMERQQGVRHLANSG